jgi:hypothetical protein
MSFGYSVGDFVLLTQLAYRVVQNTRKACGAHDDLAREVSGLHIVLRRVEVEVSKSDSILNETEDNRRRELGRLARHCKRVLKVLEQILKKYNALSDERRSVTKLWQKVKFGNGEMLDFGRIRAELATHTQALNMFLNLLSIGSQGKVEKYMDSHGEELREIKHSLHWVTASMQAKSHEEKSILTTYGEDDKAIWKAFRRELIEEGFSCQLLDKYRSTIKKYVMELGERGALDEPVQYIQEEDTQTSATSPPEHPNPPECPESNYDLVKYADAEVEEDFDNCSDENEASQEYLAQLESSSDPAVTTSSLRIEKNDSAVSSGDESEEDDDQESSMPLKPLTDDFATSTMQTKSNHHNEIEASSDEEDLPSEKMLIQKMTDHNSPHQTNQPSHEAHGDGQACLAEQPQLSTEVPRSTFRPAVEEVEDADFIDGTHPNCDISFEESSKLDASEHTTEPSQKSNLDTQDIQPPSTIIEDAGNPRIYEPVEISLGMSHIDTDESDVGSHERGESSFEDSNRVEESQDWSDGGSWESSPGIADRHIPYISPQKGWIRETPLNPRYAKSNTQYTWWILMARSILKLLLATRLTSLYGHQFVEHSPNT